MCSLWLLLLLPPVWPPPSQRSLQIYNTNMTANLQTVMPITWGMAHKFPTKQLVTGPMSATITTMGGMPIQVFADETPMSADVYANYIAPYYGGDVFAETWLPGLRVQTGEVARCRARALLRPRCFVLSTSPRLPSRRCLAFWEMQVLALRSRMCAHRVDTAS